MMVLRWLVVALVVIAPSSLLAEPRRTAVVVVGDAGAAPTIADAVVRRLTAVEAVEFLGVARVALPTPSPTSGSAAHPGTAGAIDRFYANQFEAALAELAAIQRQLADSSPANHAARLDAALWRAAILERTWADAGRSEPVPVELREAVRAALRLDPDVRIPMETFWPRFADLVESERRLLPRVEFQIRGLPPTAAVFLDGRAIGRRADVIPGTYQLRVSADGYLTHTETLDLRDNVERTLRLSPSLSTATAVAVRTGLRRDDVDSALRLARQLIGFDRAEVVVLVEIEPQQGRAVMDRGNRNSRSPVLDHRSLVDWIASAVVAASIEPTDRWQWNLSARLGFASVGTSFSWSNSSISSGRSGGGVAFGISGQRSRWLARMEVKLARDAVVAVPQSRSVEPAPTTGRPGWLGTAEWSAGARVGTDRFDFVPRLRMGLRSHRTGTLVYPGGDDPLTSGYTAIGLGLGGLFRVRPTTRLSIEAAFAVDPLAIYLESPSRGGTANPPEVASASVLTALRLGAGWVGELGASYDRIEVQYVGMPPTHVTPAPTDPRRLDEFFLFWIGARRELTHF